MVIYRKALIFFFFKDWEMLAYYLVLLVLLVHLSGLFKERDVSLCDG